MNVKLVSFALVASLCGCTTVSEVTKIGPDTYYVGSSVRGGLTSDAEVKTLSLKRAASFCAAQGKTMNVVASQSSGTQGWTPQNSEVTFTCIDDKKTQ
jgi:uncharacterized protein YcnI